MVFYKHELGRNFDRKSLKHLKSFFIENNGIFDILGLFVSVR